MERMFLEEIQELRKDYISQASFLSKQKAEIEAKYDCDYMDFDSYDKETIRAIQKLRSELKSKIVVLNFIVGEDTQIKTINYKDTALLKQRIGLKGFEDVSIS